MTHRGQSLRLALLGLLVFTLFAALGARLAYFQLGDHAELREKYQRRITYRKKIQGGRGRVLDRNGRVLALDVSKYDVGVDPSYIHRQRQSPEAVSQALAAFLNLEPAIIGSHLANVRIKYRAVEKFVDRERVNALKQHLNEKKIKGVVFDDVNTRMYPQGSLMCHVLGFVNLEGVGSAGVELLMNRFLSGKSGLRISEKDGHRRELPGRRRVEIAPRSGADVQITVDQFLQHGVEVALDRVMEEYQAKGAWAVVLETRTGAVLAMASRPHFDPNTFRAAESEQLRNRCLGMVYEPGSIIKPLVFAAALNEGLVNPKEEINCFGGVWIYRNKPLRDFHPYGLLTADDVLKKSSNIGMAQIGLRLGPKRLEAYLRAFGLGQVTGVELPGEERGIFAPHERWDGLSLTRISMGHAVSVTAMQMAVAVNAIANDGRVLRPYLVQSVTDVDGHVLFRHRPEELGPPVVRPEVAREMRRLMARIVEPGGTGTRAAIPGYTVAAKTGTAEKVVNGQYSPSQNIASFAGFFPAENPVVTIVVSVDEPGGPRRSGGVVAGPVFREIGEAAIKCLGIPPEGF